MKKSGSQAYKCIWRSCSNALWGQRSCMSDKHPANADAPGLQAALSSRDVNDPYGSSTQQCLNHTALQVRIQGWQWQPREPENKTTNWPIILIYHKQPLHSVLTDKYYFPIHLIKSNTPRVFFRNEGQ